MKSQNIIAKYPQTAALIYFLIFGWMSSICVITAFSEALTVKPSDEFFGLTKLWTFHMTFTPENWDTMQPEGFDGGRPPFFGGPSPEGNEGERPERPGRMGRPDREDRPDRIDGSGRGMGGPGRGMGGPGRGMGGPGGFMDGSDLQYVSADLNLEGETFSNVAIRFKGQATLRMTGNSLKKPYKIDFNRNVDVQEFFSLTKINLNNNAFDPSFMVEALSYETFRDFQIPAPRTAYAKVYLTVPGKFDKEYLGLYTVVEQVDSRFLKRNFGHKDGLLLKPSMVRGLPYFGENWDDYKQYDPKTEVVTWNEAKRFMDFTKFANESTDEEFRQTIGEYIDIDQFLRFLAVNVAIANYDSILQMGQNYYIYHNPETNKYVWIPWDLDLSFGKFMMGGDPDTQAQSSIREPNSVKHPLIDRLLAVEEWNEHYLQYIRQFTNEILLPDRIQQKVDAIHAVLHETVKEEPRNVYDEYLKCIARTSADNDTSSSLPPANDRRRGFRGGPMFGSFSIASWIEKRAESIRQQLEGKSEGIKMAGRGGFGPGGFGPGGPGGFGPGGPGGFGPGGPGGPGGFGPGGFGPGMFLAPQLSAALKGDQDGKITKSEWEKHTNRWAEEWDQDEDKSLSEKELSDGLSTIFKVPDEFARMGPPGGFSPGMFLIPTFLEKANNADQLESSIFRQLWSEWFTEWDANQSADLDETEIAAGLNAILRPPRDFMGGPPGF
ncbi:MAG: hypothetical protein C4527_05985 [Candidatus Omnitrophota bacterium]|jgi:spore coat protein CotH|nr:MAG: hypothetical protein C4527_05985 [Candidatus Omnitrophota bacterium]